LIGFINDRGINLSRPEGLYCFFNKNSSNWNTFGIYVSDSGPNSSLAHSGTAYWSVNVDYYVKMTSDGSGNYTVDGVAGTIVNATATVYPLVNLTYTTSVKGTNELNTDAVTDNLTGGFLTFFGFSGTWFTIAAVVLLIFMLVGLLAIVMNIAAMQGKAGSGKYSGN